MYVVAILLTSFVVITCMLLLLLLHVQPRAPVIIVHVRCGCEATAPDVPAAEGGDQLRVEHEHEDCWHTPVQETQHP